MAGYAWKWISKKDKDAFDIRIDGVALRWNSTQRDWINSPGAIDEVGSIHTVQGYDLTYAGVIIGPDLRYDPAEHRIVFDRANYHDKKGRENNPKIGLRYSDEDLLAYVRNIYTVLLTRGIRGRTCTCAMPRYATISRLTSDERIRPSCVVRMLNKKETPRPAWEIPHMPRCFAASTLHQGETRR